MKIKHRSFFSDDYSALDWEQLRNNQSETSYYLPYSKDKYIERVDTSEPSSAVKNILETASGLGLVNIFSMGSGIAALEYQIKKFSDLRIVISDYTPAVLRLKEFNIFDDCLQLDILNEALPVDENTLVLFPRIDTEFKDSQLSFIFEKLREQGVKYIFFLPAQLLGPRIVISEFKTFILSIIRKKRLIDCGYSRSKSSFIGIWSKHYRIRQEFQLGYNSLFLLIAQNNLENDRI
jgi:hypothetical protein